MHRIQSFWLLEEDVVCGLSGLEHGPCVAVHQFLHLKASLLFKHLKIVNYTLVLVFDVGLVLAHVLLNFCHLFEVRV